MPKGKREIYLKNGYPYNSKGEARGSAGNSQGKYYYAGQNSKDHRKWRVYY